MKKLLASCLLCVPFLCGAQEQSYNAHKYWETTDILSTSESVCFNSDEKVLFVSCINGNPTDKDGNGFISKISLTGEIILLRWADHLDAPKGMGISGGNLYVTDIDRVVQFSLQDGKLASVFDVPEAKFLNDITIGNDGSVYISDMFSTSIYRIKNHQIDLWLTTPLFENPNGLNFLDEELLVGTKNGIFAVNIQSKEIKHLVKDTGGIDGLEIFENGYFLISDWSGKVQLVHPSREAIVLFNTSDQGINAADIEFIGDRNLLLVPTFKDNRVVAYELVPGGN